jgi:DMSO/TMAO reductase YedYZ molybdopterin-dependent catalytic subunit
VRQQHRRQFLRAGGLAAAAFILGCDRNEVKIKSMPTAPDMEMPPDTPADQLPLAPITPNERFYLQSINGQDFDPRIDASAWQLGLDGLVDRPLAGLSYGELVAMPRQQEVITLQCIGNWTGGPLIGNAEWSGTRFANLLEMAGVQPTATRVKFYSTDGYTTSIPLARAQRENVLLVWEMNGEALPSRHGYPARLINPGHYGQKMPKWITRIELIDSDYKGYWESKPENKPYKWSDDAIAAVNSRIDAPLSLWDDVKDPDNGGVTRAYQTLGGKVGDPFLVHGIALAGERTVARVEVSTDGGGTWQEARITSQSMPNVWVTWGYEWSLPSSGRYEIIARATDSQGVTQHQIDKGVDLYDGRTGWHRVPVDVATTA